MNRSLERDERHAHIWRKPLKSSNSKPKIKDIYSCLFNMIRLGLSIIKPIALQKFTGQVEDLISDFLSTGKIYPPTIIKLQVYYSLGASVLPPAEIDNHLIKTAL